VSTDGLTAGAVARRIGVAVTTLRTWHQRYNLGPTAHEPGKHRRYTEEDIARLELMQRLTADGVPSGEAARWVRERRVANGRTWTDGLRGPQGEASRARPADGATMTTRNGSAPAATALGRAAMRLDGESVRQIIADAVRHVGVVRAWDSVLRPVLVAIGERHSRTGGLVEVEHLVSTATSNVLGAVPRPQVLGRGRVLLACTDEEQHSLPIEALAAALAQAGVVCRVLGARVPSAALRAAVQRTGPAAVLLWSQHPNTASIAQVTALSGVRTRPMLLAVAGPGWRIDDVPPNVAVPKTLAEAVELLRSAV
jgi:MerR family transcriptional regulator, light-induced transcriptional regulator